MSQTTAMLAATSTGEDGVLHGVLTGCLLALVGLASLALLHTARAVPAVISARDTAARRASPRGPPWAPPPFHRPRISLRVLRV